MSEGNPLQFDFKQKLNGQPSLISGDIHNRGRLIYCFVKVDFVADNFLGSLRLMIKVGLNGANIADIRR